MNKDNLEQLIHDYMEKYDLLNDAEHDEIYKWNAVNHFQKYWDLDTDEFGEMFKQAMEKSFNLINNGIVQPTSGIVFLCKQDKKTEREVQEEFRKLLAPDEGNIKVRQGRIHMFVDAINEKLQKAAPNKWKYNQDRRSVIMYLSFIAPDENFMFKSTEARAFSDCYEFGEDIGSGQTFRLDVYYRMCRELVDEIKKHKDLCALLEDKLKYEAEVDEDKTNPVTEVAGKYNILAYDLIYCAHAYNLYENISVRKRKKLSAVEQKRQEKENRVKDLIAQREEKNEQFEQLEKQLNEMKFPDIIGMKVKNIRYGEGIVTDQNGKYVTVEFTAGAKNFILPDAFEKGFLKSADEEISACFEEIGSLKKTKEKYEGNIRLLSTEISRLSKN